MADVSRERRAEVLRSFGAAGDVLEELITYTTPVVPPAQPPQLPLADEPHIEAWTDYVNQAHTDGALAVLARHLVQLRFPIQAGISGSEPYRLATRRGVIADGPEQPGLSLAQPASVRLRIHRTIAGQVPVVYAGGRSDFVTLVQALAERNEPVMVPHSMGACIVSGLNNWDRVARHKASWRAAHRGSTDAEWLEEFAHFARQKALYQDRVILLSSGPYASISAEEVGLPSETWSERSLGIRLAHECTHYFTLRVFGALRSHVHDELVADFVGLLQALGNYSGHHGRLVLGLAGRVTAHARIHLYCGSLTPAAKEVLFAIARTATDRLEQLAMRERRQLEDLAGLARTVFSLSCLALTDLASAEFDECLARGAS